jgi:uracil-DNA glycosylase
MSDIDRATELVLQACEALRNKGGKPRASSATLKTLAATAGQAPTSRPQTAASIPAQVLATAPAQAKPANLTAMFKDATSAASVPDTSLSSPTQPNVPVEIPARNTGRTKAAEAPSALGVQASALAPAAGSKAERISAMRTQVLPCTRCPQLVASRTQVVFGVGNPEAELMFVGEAPGADEDAAGEPFVGKAGQLLTKIIETMGLSRDSVYIANVLKCRPNMPPGESGNRKPTQPEMNTCKPYLLEQIGIIQPKALVALGATAMEGLLGLDAFPITKKRGQWHEFAGIPLMPTFHPAYLLRNQSLAIKRQVWEDMLNVLERLGHPISEKQRSYFLSK